MGQDNKKLCTVCKLSERSANMHRSQSTLQHDKVLTQVWKEYKRGRSRQTTFPGVCAIAIDQKWST